MSDVNLPDIPDNVVFKMPDRNGLSVEFEGETVLEYSGEPYWKSVLAVPGAFSSEERKRLQQAEKLSRWLIY